MMSQTRPSWMICFNNTDFYNINVLWFHFTLKNAFNSYTQILSLLLLPNLTLETIFLQLYAQIFFLIFSSIYLFIDFSRRKLLQTYDHANWN